ncbi:hypothetical protein niasHS_016564 [Heterodera schachtii]|uniref:G-protein coupled receptors family 1 profile domain-containing protein n=1 Tax=Heterodera schachtii TaxID=97005 RepID=A0ABD2HV07_HETSC
MQKNLALQQLMANVVPEQLPFRPSMPEYTDVLPPPNHDDVQVQVMAFGYMLLFLLGTCGNVAVLTMVSKNNFWGRCQKPHIL